ncbi:hypothetical protein [Saccharopolyspora sp. ASAGF58]|uniref:hypothetical protein n=1 Tax=Saccharopolyspora sp. ASAGF58 TaxID=2719023 RepID=UPI0014484E72|nr:hypothetical protein [Saccharopolyspora sp. ASAGF58]
MSSADGGQHPEVPDPATRDYSLLMTEAEQARTLGVLTEIEYKLCQALHEAQAGNALTRSLLDQQAAAWRSFLTCTREALRNIVTVEERIGHLDFKS